MFEIELHPILVDLAYIAAGDHSFSNSISGKNVVKNTSVLSRFLHVSGLLTTTVSENTH